MAKKNGTFEVIEHLFLCDGATAIPRNQKQTIQYLKTGKKRAKDEIHLEIGALKELLSDNLPDVMKDLLEIATFVYAAGQLTTRGGNKEIEYGYKWHREFDLAIPIRKYEIWTDSQTKELLEDLLSFVAGERYTFYFTQKQKEIPEFLELQDSAEDPHHIQEVVLFSGGMDSFAGAVDEISGQGKKVALVSHCSEAKMKSLQRNVYKYLTDNCAGPKPLHVPVQIWKGGHYITKDTNQRNRSFLFATLGALVAKTIGHSRARFYENGIVSCNLPFDSQTPQARRTRSTHPKFLTDMSELIERITGETFKFENPYFSMTRADIVKRIIEQQNTKGIATTRSCVKSRYQGETRHDGVCSQCVDRRFAIIANDCVQYESENEYQVDIFLDDIDKTTDRTMVLGYIFLAENVIECDMEKFYERFSSDLIEITNSMGMSRKTAISHIYNLYRNHSKQVKGVLKKQIQKYPDIVMTGKPRYCLLSMLAHQEHLKYPKLVKQIEEGTKKHGKGELERKVRHHLDRDPSLTARQIAKKIGNTSVPSVKQVKARLNNK